MKVLLSTGEEGTIKKILWNKVEVEIYGVGKRIFDEKFVEVIEEEEGDV
jgi:hypothetical protein